MSGRKRESNSLDNYFLVDSSVDHKKPRAVETTTSPLLLVNLECHLCTAIFQFASRLDLANIACTCRRFAVVCQNNETLDQTRVAIVDGRAWFPRVLEGLEWGQQNGDFDHRFKHLKFVNHSITQNFNDLITDVSQDSTTKLSFTSVDFSFSRPLEDSKRQIHPTILYHLFSRMPMLECVNLSYVFTNASTVLLLLSLDCPLLERICWDHGGLSTFSADGFMLRSCANLKELYLNDFCFRVDSKDMECNMFGDCHTVYPLRFCNKKLERVSLKHAKYTVDDAVKYFTQSSLIKFVRSSPKLQWFQSNLTKENVEVLQLEFPQLTFC